MRLRPFLFAAALLAACGHVPMNNTPFPCGPIGSTDPNNVGTTCQNGEYCEITFLGDAEQTMWNVCHPYPQECQGTPTCDCLWPTEKAAGLCDPNETCSDDGQGHVLLTGCEEP